MLWDSQFEAFSPLLAKGNRQLLIYTTEAELTWIPPNPQQDAAVPSERLFTDHCQATVMWTTPDPVSKEAEKIYN